jgi:serine/threonine protein kinase
MFFTPYSYLWYEENEKGIFDAILRGHIDFASDPWPSISSSAKDLVKKMLRNDPKERLSAVEVLSKSNSSSIQKVICFTPKVVYIWFWSCWRWGKFWHCLLTERDFDHVGCYIMIKWGWDNEQDIGYEYSK